LERCLILIIAHLRYPPAAIAAWRLTVTDRPVETQSLRPGCNREDLRRWRGEEEWEEEWEKEWEKEWEHEPTCTISPWLSIATGSPFTCSRTEPAVIPACAPCPYTRCTMCWESDIFMSMPSGSPFLDSTTSYSSYLEMHRGL
jgi:hypothetical protein